MFVVLLYFLFRINDGDEVVRYYPHRDEKLPQDIPSPVLMVSRVKPLYGEPWFNKDYARQLVSIILATETICVNCPLHCAMQNA